jgi:hypothetical protein
MWWILTSLLACAPDLTGAYADERTRALAVASERIVDFQPDMRVQISDADFQRAVFAAVRNAVTEVAPVRMQLPFGMQAEARPRLTLKRATLRSSDVCPTCIGFSVDLDGSAPWTLGPASGSVPFDVGADGVLGVEVVDGHLVQARLRSVDAVRVRVLDLAGLSMNPADVLRDRIRALIAEKVPAIDLVDMRASGLPLRDLRVRTGGGAITVEALTNVPGALPVSGAALLSGGIRVAVSETALLGLARRAAFEQGELTMQVYADPRALSVTGDRFTLDLRLWRLVGRGWWRDYTVTGTLRVQDGKLRLSADDVVETAHSPGAGLVDPLAALFEGQVLAAIESSLQQSLPAAHAERFRNVEFRAAVRDVSGADGTLLVHAALDVKPAGER